MTWLLTMVLCATIVELVLRLPFLEHLKALRCSSDRAMRVLTAKGVSDHWKQKAIGAYARKTFVASVKIAGLLTVVLGTATILFVALARLSDGFQAFIVSWTGLWGSVVVASLYVVARKVSNRGSI